jgi:hypothetical protein
MKMGMNAAEAALAAAKLRLRPILMTSFAFIFGVLPLALSTGAGSGGQNAIGRGVVGGMLSATVLAIFFVPVFFVVVKRPVPAGPTGAGARRPRRRREDAPASASRAAGRGWPAERLHRPGPAYHRPAAPTPASLPAGPAYPAPARCAAQPVVGWRDFFSDPKLKTVIERALANNRDLRVAVANIAAARAQYHVQRAALFPTINAQRRRHATARSRPASSPAARRPASPARSTSTSTA